MEKKKAGYFLTGMGCIFALVMALIILGELIDNPNFNLFPAIFIFVVPIIIIIVGCKLLNSSDK